MPIFIRNKLLFIHIPKCGGDTINFALKNSGDTPFLFVPDGSVMINNHTPQHSTWRELKNMGWTTPAGFRVAALVRHPVDRVLSTFRYIYHFRKDLLPSAKTPSEFLDNFLSREPGVNARFDNHNKSLMDFLVNENGTIDPIIHIRPLVECDLWLNELGLPKISINERKNVTSILSANLPKFTQENIEQIKDFYKEDILWYESNFPASR